MPSFFPRQRPFCSIAIAAALATSITSASNAADSPTHTFSSPEHQVTLLELYTSEGCSSCPPADSWLAELTGDSRLWQRIVPIAFHVDYWNYLGWEDALSNPRYAQRQRQYKASGAARAVYTPGFFLNGREWRGWFDRNALPSPAEKSPGVLSGVINGNDLCVTFTPSPHIEGPFTLETALLGFDITNVISRGENRGRELTHQFAVLEHSSAPAHGDKPWCKGLATQGWPTDKLGVAVWVTREGEPDPLQATGAWLP